MSRLAAYAGTSTVLATAVIIRAFHQRANFYSAAVYLAQSNACLMILTNLLLLILCMGMVGLQRLLYGPLRPIEIEQLYEKAWFAITETCLAMTIFRDEVGGWFLVMFIALLVGKVWGWIGEGRVEVLEQQPPTNPTLFHARLSFSLFLSMALDLCLLRYAVLTVLDMARASMMVMFVFEFAVLTISSSSTTARYAISLAETYIIKRQTQAKLEARRAELRAARAASGQQASTAANGLPEVEDEIDEMDIDVPGWEEKGQWIVCLDLLTDFLKLVVYLSFFFILLTFYGLPIHIMRDVFLTLRSFFKRITDFMRYRRATKDMNERYPDASPEEVGRGEVCIICREEMRPWAAEDQARPADAAAVTTRVDERSRPKKLPCGHILHFGCLRSWLERQQICPTCRRPVIVTDQIVVGNGEREGRRGAREANAGRHHRPQQEGGAAPAGHGQPDAAANPRNRARVVNFGPLRIGFGVGQNDVFENLAQQIQNGQAGPVPPANPVAGPGANDGRTHFGFGLGFGRVPAPPAPAQPAAPLHPTTSQVPMQTQLHQMEHQINLEITNLRATADQLRLVQALQAELGRIRQAQGGPGRGLTTPYAPNPWLPPTARPPLISGQSHMAVPQRPAMGPGHPELPAHMTLPPGWTVLPLTRVDGSVASQGVAVTEPASGVPVADTTTAATDTPLLGLDLRGPFASTENDRDESTQSRTVPGASLAQRSPMSSQTVVQGSTMAAPGRSPPHASAGTATTGPTSRTSRPQEDTNTNIPSWGAAHPDAPAESVKPDNVGGSVDVSDARVSSPDSQGSPAGDASQGKGKARAATVEEIIDDIQS
ncbi:MAG: E3 ubiquitin-protein ligase hrd1 [Thelocarpon superellum]|nr:MAG: E3 ubiquitin-protein ligase hrd1 [Thelocarpon superellum]